MRSSSSGPQKLPGNHCCSLCIRNHQPLVSNPINRVCPLRPHLTSGNELLGADALRSIESGLSATCFCFNYLRHTQHKAFSQPTNSEAIMVRIEQKNKGGCITFVVLRYTKAGYLCAYRFKLWSETCNESVEWFSLASPIGTGQAKRIVQSLNVSVGVPVFFALPKLTHIL